MEKAQTKFTVLFENPFWIGVYEREYDGRYEICKITFGAEPKDYEVYWFLLQHYRELKFSPSIESAGKTEGYMNPKDVYKRQEKGYTGYNGRSDKKASGIGLYLCRRICQNLGHSITANSSLDSGTVIRIRLDQKKLEIE